MRNEEDILRTLMHRSPDEHRDWLNETLQLVAWPPDLKPSITYDRFEDMSPDGRLAVYIQQDGDVIVTVFPEASRGRPAASVEFTTIGTGGGQSPRTFAALRLLAEAIRLDNLEKPQHRES